MKRIKKTLLVCELVAYPYVSLLTLCKDLRCTLFVLRLYCFLFVASLTIMCIFIVSSGINFQGQPSSHLSYCFHHILLTWLRSFGFAWDIQIPWHTNLFQRYNFTFMIMNMCTTLFSYGEKFPLFSLTLCLSR